MEVKSKRVGNRVIFDNFIVICESDNFYGVYQKSCILSEKTGKLITSGKTLGAACIKAKLLQIGYNMHKELDSDY